MIYLYQNNKEYDYDVRAIALAFFERTKIMEVSEDQLDETGDVLRLRLVYGQESIEGCLYDGEGRRVEKNIHCNYRDHEHCRNEVCRFLYRLFADRKNLALGDAYRDTSD